MLNLYWKSESHSRNLLPKPFNTEADFENYVFTNQDLLGDVFILYRQIHTGNKQGIPDMLGVDQDSRICIIEMKNVVVSEEILPQVFLTLPSLRIVALNPRNCHAFLQQLPKSGLFHHLPQISDCPGPSSPALRRNPSLGYQECPSGMPRRLLWPIGTTPSPPG